MSSITRKEINSNFRTKNKRLMKELTKKRKAFGLSTRLLNRRIIHCVHTPCINSIFKRISSRRNQLTGLTVSEFNTFGFTKERSIRNAKSSATHSATLPTRSTFTRESSHGVLRETLPLDHYIKNKLKRTRYYIGFQK